MNERTNKGKRLVLTAVEANAFERDKMAEKLTFAIEIFDSMVGRFHATCPLDRQSYRDQLVSLRNRCGEASLTSAELVADLCRELLKVEASTVLVGDAADSIYGVLDTAIDLFPKNVVHHFEEIQYRDAHESE